MDDGCRGCKAPYCVSLSIQSLCALFATVPWGFVSFGSPYMLDDGYSLQEIGACSCPHSVEQTRAAPCEE